MKKTRLRKIIILAVWLLLAGGLVSFSMIRGYLGPKSWRKALSTAAVQGVSWVKNATLPKFGKNADGQKEKKFVDRRAEYFLKIIMQLYFEGRLKPELYDRIFEAAKTDDDLLSYLVSVGHFSDPENFSKITPEVIGRLGTTDLLNLMNNMPMFNTE